MQARGDFDIGKIRGDFPIFQKAMHGQPLVYLDSATTAQKPRQVLEAISRYYREEYGTVHRALYDLVTHSTELYSTTREKVRHFIGAKEMEEIIFTKGTTESINLVALSFGRASLKEGDEILISEMEHHSNIVPWQLLSREKKSLLKVIPVDEDGELILEEYEQLLSERTKIVSLTHVSNVTGKINPIKEIARMAHRVGAIVLVDGAQAVAHLPIDVFSSDIDFYAFSGHKMYAPTGIGILYGKKSLLERMPPFLGGSDMIETVTLETSTFQPPPLKFEAGTPHIGGVIGLGHAIDYIQSVGKTATSQWQEKLLSHARKKIGEIERMRTIGSTRNTICSISFAIEGIHPFDLGTLLNLKGVALRTGHLCAQPLLRRFGVEVLARISFGIYTTYDDLDRFFYALREAIALLNPNIAD